MTLLVGPAVPVPVPQVVLDSLTSVEVTVTSGQPSGFKLSFTLSNKSPLQTIFLLSGGAIPPVIRVIIVVTVNGIPNVLMDGVMTQHQVAPGSDAGHSTLTIMGEDLTRVMDFIPFDGLPYPAMPIQARVALIIGKYGLFGLIPLVIPPLFPDVSLPTERIDRHQGTDLAYIKKLADDVGYVFYITPGPAPGANVAYFGPLIKVGVPQPALNIDMDAHTNVESLSFEFDNTSATTPIVFIQNPITKVPPIPIPLPNISLLNPPLGLIPPVRQRMEFITETAKLSFPQAASMLLARASQAADAVKARGTLDVLRYGRTLGARGLVGVRGAGMAFDGLYYVDSVTHNIKRGEYKQSFTLTRNGLVSTVPRVPA